MPVKEKVELPSFALTRWPMIIIIMKFEMMIIIMMLGIMIMAMMMPSLGAHGNNHGYYHSSYLSQPPQPAVVYFFQAGVLFSSENAKGTAFSNVYSENIKAKGKVQNKNKKIK